MDKNKYNIYSDSSLVSGLELIRSLYHLNIRKIVTSSDIHDFCNAGRIHFIQRYLSHDILEALLNNDDENTVYLCEDKLLICISLFHIGDFTFAAGPFRQSILSKPDVKKILALHGITGLSEDDYLHYHETSPIISEDDMKKIVSSLRQIYAPGSQTISVIKLDDYYTNSINTETSADREMMAQADRPYYMTMLERRYTFEQRFIENIEEGNARSALMNLENMQQDVTYLKKIGTTMENERIGAAITRTTVRLAAVRAGLPAIIADKISSENTRKTMTAKTTSEILKAKEELVKNFCHAIKEHNDEHHSALAQSAVYYLRHEYYHPINLDAMADTLSVSKNYLISVFRKEYNTTPINYLNDYRLKQAATLLASTSSTVQEISAGVGIDDANYFVKLFKKKYEMTPSEYRRRMKL